MNSDYKATIAKVGLILEIITEAFVLVKVVQVDTVIQ